jgi:predicted ATPase/DNA-binding winged helix-turn-helix (wHTH) protein
MPPLSIPVDPIRFHGWEIRPSERLLLVDGRPMTVGSRAFDLLCVLAARAGQVVTKAELLDAAWPGLVVEENNVSVQVAALRKLLGPGTITTVSGIGYLLGDTVVDASAPAAPSAAPAPRATLPVEDELVGRTQELATLREWCRERPLVTIVGTGGVGKTSLARAVVALVAAQDACPIHWVDLTPVRDEIQFLAALGKVLGIDAGGYAEARGQLLRALGTLEAVVALDNCEQVLAEVAAFVTEARGAAPAVRWLATSQAPLHVNHETVYRLTPLEVPETGVSATEAATSGAMALLVRRVVALDPDFVLTEAGLATAVDLCRQLDGLPLAIEMAAARVATLGLDEVHRQLGQRLRMLKDVRGTLARHHTLRSMFDWSHELLSPLERKMFRRLHPFEGGFTVALMVRVACDPDEVPAPLDEWQAIDLLDALVDKSFVQRSADSPGRFFLLENARNYAALQLAEAGEVASVRRRHAHVLASWFDSAQVDAGRMRDAEWSARYVPERHNVRAGLAWACTANEPDVLASLTAALAQIDAFAHLGAEVLLFDLPLHVLGDAMPSLRAAACLGLCWAHYADGNREVATELAQRALADFSAVGDADGAYRALTQLIRVYETRPGMQAHAREYRDRLQAMDDRDVPVRTRLMAAILLAPYGGETVTRLHSLHDMAHHAGLDTLAAICRAHLTDRLLVERRFAAVAELAARYIEAGEVLPRARALILNNQAQALIELGRFEEAHEAARAALTALPSLVAMVIDVFASAALKQGREVNAAVLHGFGHRLRADRDQVPGRAEAATIAGTRSLLEATFDAERLDELCRMGAALSTAEALALAFRPSSAEPGTGQHQSLQIE